MKTFSCSLLAALTVAAALPTAAMAAEPAAGAGALSTAQAADFSEVAPARNGNPNLPATNPTPGSLQPQTPETLNPALKTEKMDPKSSPQNSSASGLTVPGATSGSTFGSGSNSTLKGTETPGTVTKPDPAATETKK